MARWQRDPRARRRVAGVVALIDTLAAGALGYHIFLAGWVRVVIRIGHRDWIQPGATAAVIFAAALAAWLLFQTTRYVDGRPWARYGFVVVNAALVAAGLGWFLLNFGGSAEPDPDAALFGLVLPMITLFPLIGFFLAFKPQLPVRQV